MSKILNFIIFLTARVIIYARMYYSNMSIHSTCTKIIFFPKNEFHTFWSLSANSIFVTLGKIFCSALNFVVASVLPHVYRESPPSELPAMSANVLKMTQFKEVNQK